MKIQTTLLVLALGVPLILCLAWVIRLIAGTLPSGDYEGLQHSISIIYDFSDGPDTLNHDIETLRTLNQNYISEVILVAREQKYKKAIDLALGSSKFYDKLIVVVIESAGEEVSSGQARMQALKHTNATYLLFLASGHVPDSKDFLEIMLSEVSSSPDAVIVPAHKSARTAVPYLTANLNLILSQPQSISGKHLLPVIDSTAFMMRSDLYHAVGGYDDFFYKKDLSDIIALSLSVWLCGGSVVQVDSATVTGNYMEFGNQAIENLRYAYYITNAYAYDMSEKLTYPGLEFYTPTVYDEASVKKRRTALKESCLPFQWYTKKFPDYLNVKTESKFYNPNYVAEIPKEIPYTSNKGKWFVLFAGYCVFVGENLWLDMDWCPEKLTEKHIFTWLPNGQVVSGGHCVTVDPSNTYLRMEHCDEKKLSQIFTYNKTTELILSKDSLTCVTHINGPNSKQVLGMMSCEGNAPFNIFVLDDQY